MRVIGEVTDMLHLKRFCAFTCMHAAIYSQLTMATPLIRRYKPPNPHHIQLQRSVRQRRRMIRE